MDSATADPNASQQHTLEILPQVFGNSMGKRLERLRALEAQRVELESKLQVVEETIYTEEVDLLHREGPGAVLVQAGTRADFALWYDNKAVLNKNSRQMDFIFSTSSSTSQVSRGLDSDSSR